MHLRPYSNIWPKNTYTINTPLLAHATWRLCRVSLYSCMNVVLGLVLSLNWTLLNDQSVTWRRWQGEIPRVLCDRPKSAWRRSIWAFQNWGGDEQQWSVQVCASEWCVRLCVCWHVCTPLSIQLYMHRYTSSCICVLTGTATFCKSGKVVWQSIEYRQVDGRCSFPRLI